MTVLASGASMTAASSPGPTGTLVGPRRGKILSSRDASSRSLIISSSVNLCILPCHQRSAGAPARSHGFSTASFSGRLRNRPPEFLVHGERGLHRLDDPL